MPRDARKYLFDIGEASKKIVSFRNVLIHGYADVDDELVWDIVETRLPVLREEIGRLIGGRLDNT